MQDQSGMIGSEKENFVEQVDRETLCVEVEAFSDSEAVSENLRLSSRFFLLPACIHAVELLRVEVAFGAKL